MILKVIRRFQHFNKDQYLKPKFFDKWREYINAKRRFRYWLNFVDKRSQVVKSDLHYAFDVWKQFYPSRLGDLTVLSR
jgi:hypothetical protein